LQQNGYPASCGACLGCLGCLGCVKALSQNKYASADSFVACGAFFCFVLSIKSSSDLNCLALNLSPLLSASANAFCNSHLVGLRVLVTFGKGVVFLPVEVKNCSPEENLHPIFPCCAFCKGGIN